MVEYYKTNTITDQNSDWVMSGEWHELSRQYDYPAGRAYDVQTLFEPLSSNDPLNHQNEDFTYGINGSLRKREVTHPEQHTEYYLFNSQGNLKAYSDDVMSFAYYGYNANNTRTYKLSMYNTNQWVNGQPHPLNLQWQHAMFYPNTYLNFNANGEYTKHYYNGNERIASRLGENNIDITLNNTNSVQLCNYKEFSFTIASLHIKHW